MTTNQPDYSKFKQYKGKFYLHNACLADSIMPHNARFTVTSSPNPENTLRYGPASFRVACATKRYLSEVWGRPAKGQEGVA